MKIISTSTIQIPIHRINPDLVRVDRFYDEKEKKNVFE